MSDSSVAQGGSKRKLIYFTGFIILLILGLSAGWYWASGKLDEQAGLFTSNLAAQGKNLDCGNRQVRGYPFRIGIFCDSVAFEDPEASVKISGNGFRSAAQLYRPGHFVAELESPFEVVIPGLAPLTVDWENLKSSSNIGTSGLKRISIVADQIFVSANDFGQRDLLGSVKQLQIHARAGEGDQVKDLDVAFRGDQWLIDDNEANLIEPVFFDFDGRLADGVVMAQAGRPLVEVLREKGGKGNLNGFTFSTQSGGLLKVSGPLEVSASGMLSGELSLDVEDPQKLINYIGSVFPPAVADLNNINQYLEAFAKRSGDKVTIKDLKLQIKDGDVFFGFLQIGKIPRLF